ncbi:MAG: Gfo/Idh/MocA family oxidoreductase [Planctomycetes bacterium]|nr:Gfo/Idh/MocA family oxidoreductase [Planctomycetota bacterium]
MKETYRVGVIGATGRGDYGHGLDTAFQGIDGAKIVAVSDPDARGLARTAARLGVSRTYTDYREMLAREKLDVVSIGPRWVTDRVAMVRAAAGAGCHIFCEKPLAGTLEEADEMVEACRSARVKMSLAHQFRGLPPVRLAIQEVQSGRYGKLLRMRARPKDDHRGGGEELVVHGTHLFDLMIAFAGPPRWVSGHVVQDGRDVTRKDAREGTEPAGPLAGDSITALFGFEHGVRAYFDSSSNQHQPGKMLYGVLFECERALLHVRRLGDVYLYPAPMTIPEEAGLTWQRMVLPEWHIGPDGKPRSLQDWLELGNQALVQDLIRAIEGDTEPPSSVRDGVFVTEMIQGVYASHFADGVRLRIPLSDRCHPLLAGLG